MAFFCLVFPPALTSPHGERAAPSYCQTTVREDRYWTYNDGKVYTFRIDIPAYEYSSGSLTTDCLMNNGAKGKGVQALQHSINNCYTQTPVKDRLSEDGVYGDLTKAAMKKYPIIDPFDFALRAPPSQLLHPLSDIHASAKSLFAKTYLAGTIARALAVFSVDEIVIFHDQPNAPPSTPADYRHYTGNSDPSHFLAHVLSFLETPPSLRKLLFPMHPNLEMAGTLPSLDMPHHPRLNETPLYREGVVTEPPQSFSSSKSKTEKHIYVTTGLPNPHRLPSSNFSSPISTGIRITLSMAPPPPPASPPSSLPVPVPVPPDTPRTTHGFYWGYTTRLAPSLSSIFTTSPHLPSGYTYTIGLSERGTPLPSLPPLPSPSPNPPNDQDQDPETQPPPPPPPPPAQHYLIVLGGLGGLESAADNDPELKEKGITGGNVKELFDEWVNVVPGQGSRTVRTEEAVWVGLAGLRGRLGFVE
ncbi:MAG: hypothetical protein Q9227_003730 [Pyrenula ochraceoflavens]